ncbi:MAG: nitrile hydratase accessory protein [Silicimonas sp.]|nr:nitrile hydratase accessory protein [Silicimonas sp.]
MNAPDDPLAPLGHDFKEPWHAQVLAGAQALIRAGHLDPTTWAETLGAALREAEAAGAPDTEETYYLAALSALEQVAPFGAETLTARKTAWAEAYRRTPHGKPVVL